MLILVRPAHRKRCAADFCNKCPIGCDQVRVADSRSQIGRMRRENPVEEVGPERYTSVGMRRQFISSQSPNAGTRVLVLPGIGVFPKSRYTVTKRTS